jgi:hypothetical protein
MCIAAAIGGAAVLGAGVNMYEGNKAANAQKNAAKNASDTQMAMYDQTRADLSPYRSAGTDALSALESFYGIGGKAPGNWQKTLQGLPGYQFQLQQGSKSVDQNLAARGLLQSGAAGKALTQYGQGLASNYADKYTSGLAGIAGLGESAGAQTGAFGANAANGSANNQINAGNAQAGGYINAANSINSGLQGVAGAYGMYQGQQQLGQQQQLPSDPNPWTPSYMDTQGYGLT